MEFHITVLLRPEVERDRGEFVNQRVGQAVLGEIDGLDVIVAGVAAFDAYVRELFSCIDGKFGLVFLAAPSANDAAKLPFAETFAARRCV